jgi:hypothetical protein
MKTIIKAHQLLTIVATGTIDAIHAHTALPDEAKELASELIETSPFYEICTESTQDNRFQIEQSWRGEPYFIVRERQEVPEQIYAIDSIQEEVANFRKKHNSDQIFWRQASKKEMERGFVAHICDYHKNTYASIVEE